MSAEPATKRQKLQPYVFITNLTSSPTQDASIRKPISSSSSHHSLSSRASWTRPPLHSLASIAKTNGNTKRVSFGRSRGSMSRASSVTSVSSQTEAAAMGSNPPFRLSTTRFKPTYPRVSDGPDNRFKPSSSSANEKRPHRWIESRDSSPDEMLLSAAQTGLSALRVEGQLSQEMDDLVIRDSTPRSSSSKHQSNDDFVEDFYDIEDEDEPSPLVPLSTTQQRSAGFNSRPPLPVAKQSLLDSLKNPQTKPILIKAAPPGTTKPISQSSVPTVPCQIPMTPITNSTAPPFTGSPGSRIKTEMDEEESRGSSLHICLADPILERSRHIQDCDVERIRQQLNSHALRARKGKERLLAYESRRTITPAQRYLELLEHMYGPGDPRRGHMKKRPQFKPVLSKPLAKKQTLDLQPLTNTRPDISDSTPSSSRSVGEGILTNFNLADSLNLEPPGPTPLIDIEAASHVSNVLNDMDVDMILRAP